MTCTNTSPAPCQAVDLYPVRRSGAAVTSSGRVSVRRPTAGRLLAVAVSRVRVRLPADLTVSITSGRHQPAHQPSPLIGTAPGAPLFVTAAPRPPPPALQYGTAPAAPSRERRRRANSAAGTPRTARPSSQASAAFRDRAEFADLTRLAGGSGGGGRRRTAHEAQMVPDLCRSVGAARWDERGV